MESGYWRSRHEEGHGMRAAVGDLVRAAAEPGWSRLTVRHAQVGTRTRTTVLRDGHEITVEGLAEDLAGPFRRLRELSHRAGEGTWFTCELSFSPGGRGYTGHVDSRAQPFERVPATAALTELTLFPRDEPPDWLLAALPTAAPLGLTVAYGGDHGRRSPGEPPPPSLPVTGELSYLPEATMTARSFEHTWEYGQPTVFLRERPGDRQAGHLLVSRHRDTFWMARHGMRGSGEGLRAVTLDGRVLRFELSPRTADTLETETVFEISLDLPQETVGEMRAALSGILRAVTRAPELTGL
ncbi:hypothetical protein ABZ470_35030 [Streptosporangium sp. NPDC020072]|uniref:DUF4429 domain-containing protein n=1 Tax=Streptosporangium jomthongense TaxID=1193683 RepID=A0ABV8F0Y6_9ACTN